MKNLNRGTLRKSIEICQHERRKLDSEGNVVSADTKDCALAAVACNKNKTDEPCCGYALNPEGAVCLPREEVDLEGALGSVGVLFSILFLGAL